jgi:DNA ligase-1
VELPDGTRFSIGTGFSDAQRERPPAVGSIVTFRYQELSDRGVPRFPSFVRVRQEAVVETATPTAAEKRKPSGRVGQASLRALAHQPPVDGANVPSAATATRHFEFVEGGSAKFWEISTTGNDVCVRFGRIGTKGQTQTKSFGDADAAAKHVEKLVSEKTKKGYVES